MFKLIDLTSEVKFHISGRGDVYVCDVPYLNLTLGDVRRWAANETEVMIDGWRYTVRGVETCGLFDEAKATKIGVLV